MKKNIVYVDPFATKLKPDLEYLHGFVKALKQKHNVVVVNNLNINHIKDLTKYFFRVDAIIFGLAVSKQGYIEGFYNRTIPGLAQLSVPKICFVLSIDDFETKLNWMKRHKITHIFSEYYKIKELVTDSGIEAERLLFATTDIAVPIVEEKQYDFGFTGALHTPEHDGNKYNIREKVEQLITDANITTLFLKNKRLSLREYYEMIGKTKICLCTTSIPHGTIAPRFYDLAKGKCLIFCDEWEDTYDGVFEDGVNCVMFKRDLSDFQEKLMYYLENENERERIINQAYSGVMAKHLWSNRVDKLCRITGL